MNEVPRSLEGAVDGVLGRFGITMEQFHILRHIRRGYRSVKDLAEKKQINRSAVSQAIDALVSKGLVTRIQESGDRR
jgi:DNA-binding MarR family transcriptional regulator